MRKAIVRVCIGVAACGVLAFAQTAQFEVASVKPAPPDARGMRCTGGPGTSDPGTLTCENYSLSFLVMMAAGPVASNESESEFGTSLIDVRDQLGLRLEKKKGQADVLVVDHAEKASIEN
jgi:hypothetical protein